MPAAWLQAKSRCWRFFPFQGVPMISGIDPRVDYAFKRVFGSTTSTPILADLLNAVLKPAQRIVELQLLNPFNDKDGIDDKLSILDIKARDELGQHYNVEMQLFGSRIHLQRILYYWAVLHGDQLREGQKYTELRPTISIAIVNSVLFPDVPDYHLEFQLRCSRHPQLTFSTHQAIHLLELPKFRKTDDELTDLLDVWCYFLTHGAELDRTQLPKGLQAPMVQRAMEVLEMLSQNDVERERYRARLKWEREQTAYVDEAREQGEWIGRIHFAQELLNLPETPRAELGSLSIEELQMRVRALGQQLHARGK
jgi:predicted transposase/invertase (TIGR01784 family)